MVVRFKTERLKRALNARTAYVPITLLDAGESEEVIFSAFQALKSNHILITECDEFEAWRPHKNRRTSFLGCSSPVDRTLDLLQRRHRSPVIMGIVCRETGYSYGLKLQSLVNSSEATASNSISEQALRILEEYIRMAPDQWYQWKEVRTLLGTDIFEETTPIYETDTDHSLPIADSPLHARQA
jgi:predicted LPLAT superfamily acyltransferase